MAGQPLIISDDELLLDDLLRVAAAAGVEVTHTREPDSRTLWRAAGVVLIDAAQVSAAVDAVAAPAAGGRGGGVGPAARRSSGNCASASGWIELFCCRNPRRS